MKATRAAAVALLLCFIPDGRASAPSTMAAKKPVDQVCSSLTGPFCLHLGADASFATYMTPIELPTRDQNADPDEINSHQTNKCFFRHFTRSWMDAGGEKNDILSARVKTSDECEQLCCEDPKCKSYTFWMGHTCFLRATKNRPRKDGNSFSANKLQ